jgi:hypothetical protein
MNEFIVDKENAKFSTLKGVLFNKSKTILVECPTAMQGSYSVPYGVKTIGLGAFESCDKLKKITIPASVTKIGQSFYGCFALTQYSVSMSNVNYSSLNGVLYNKNKSLIISYPNSKSGSYKLPSNVYTIGSNAFINCRLLTSIFIPKSVRKIDQQAFFACVKLKNAYFLGNGPKMGVCVFDACNAKFRIRYLYGSTGFANRWHGYISTTYIPTPTAKAIKVVNNRIKITWTKSTGATGYKLYRSTSSNAQYSLILTTNTLSFTDDGLTKGQIYFYKVRAYRKNVKNLEFSNYSNAVSQRALLMV